MTRLPSDTCMMSRRQFAGAALALPAALHAGLRKAVAEQRGNVRSIVLLWMWGGPSHLDTFDPKPKAPAEIRGPFSSIVTRTTGLRFTELFPRLAARSDRFSVVRSNINFDNAHHVAGSIALTGERGANGDNDYPPNFGSILDRSGLGNRELPPFVAIGSGPLNTAIGGVKGYGGGRWGKSFDPFPVRCTELAGVELPTLALGDDLPRGRLQDRRELLTKLDDAERLVEQSVTRKWDADFARAWNLLASADGRRAFDLTREKDNVRASYGRTQFGQSCLLARRLVEAKVPYIQVNWSEWVENIYDSRTDFGWDTHWLNFEHLADRHGPIFDRAASALLDDLQQRGLLDSTLVVAMGEFGRTPKVSANGGRDHWHRCYSSLWAGGGVQPGRVIGESDSRAYDPLTEPVTPAMVGTTMLELAGLHSQQRAELRVLSKGRLIDELF